mmetsp:Transcript_5272/g.16978  ORF Transcript_5272/g.16978 Transcript_5272/m.16978 type:complete len:216 (-) Transcript_5272:745-1392(-)
MFWVSDRRSTTLSWRLSAACLRLLPRRTLWMVWRLARSRLLTETPKTRRSAKHTAACVPCIMSMQKARPVNIALALEPTAIAMAMPVVTIAMFWPSRAHRLSMLRANKPVTLKNSKRMMGRANRVTYQRCIHSRKAEAVSISMSCTTESTKNRITLSELTWRSHRGLPLLGKIVVASIPMLRPRCGMNTKNMRQEHATTPTVAATAPTNGAGFAQ